MKKLIALDLDGTLLDENSIVPESTREYLIKLKEKGNIISIASGRTVQSAIDVTDGAELEYLMKIVSYMNIEKVKLILFQMISGVKKKIFYI